VKRIIVLSATAFSVFLTIVSCVDHKIAPATSSSATDASLYAEINETGYEYFQNGDKISPASASPHGEFRLRFNEEAFSSLDGSGELPESGEFIPGSVIVKETYNANGFNIYAVIKKAPSDPSSGSGWLWAEYALDGTTLVAISSKGSGCISCHDDTPNRDLVRSFDFH